jgi:hypothetical protein
MGTRRKCEIRNVRRVGVRRDDPRGLIGARQQREIGHPCEEAIDRFFAHRDQGDIATAAKRGVFCFEEHLMSDK